MGCILTIDDEPAITDLISRALTRDGHTVKTINDPTEVLRLDLSRYDLIMCDVMMPEIDGFELVQRIRELVDAPILFLTAKVAEEDAVQGLGIGADDYIRKPFGLAELRAKVKAHLRREARPHTHMLILGSTRFDLDARELFVNGVQVPLTPTEYAICEYLAQYHGQVLSRAQIRDEVFDWASDTGEESVSMHISNSRIKLRGAGIDPIKTTRGVGYKWQS